MPPLDASEIALLRAETAKLETEAAESRRTLESLASVAARATSILEVAQDGIVTIDETGIIQSANPAMGLIFGYDSRELIGQNVTLIMPSPFSDEHDEYLARYRATGEQRILGTSRQAEGLHRDGLIFPIELSVNEGFDGTRRFFTAMVRDITAHEEARKRIRENEERLQAIFDSAVDGIITIDEMGIIESLNPAASKLFDYPEDELLGKNVKLVMPSSYHEEHDGYLENYRSSGQKKIIGIYREVIGLRKDGTTFPMHLAVSEGVVRHRRIFTGIVRDLSEREEARAAKESLAAILEDSLNEIFVFHADSLRFLQVNRGARENLGYSLEQLRALTPVDIKPELGTDEFQDLIEPLRVGAKKRVHFETVHQRIDGSRYPVDVHLQLGTYSGESAFIALIIDMSERVEIRKTLERVEARAKQAEQLASIATLTAGIAHDIGTPMSVILGYANMMETTLEDEKQKKRARVIGEQTQRVTGLIQTLLNMSRPHEPNRIPLQLSEVFDHSLQFFQEKLKVRGIEVERDFAGATNVLGDRDQLEQVFLNLLVNAADAMPSGGDLMIRIQPLASDSVEVCVEDTGTGIAPENLERIFDPFYTTKDRGKGNGLGLLVSKRIIVEHGGSIEVTSTLGEGTRFRITLPCGESAA